MADYYAVLKRAVGGLPGNTGEARRGVYEKARKAIIRQLETFDPPLSPSEITRQRLSLEECIRRVEAEAARESLGLGSASATPPSPPAQPPITPPPPLGTAPGGASTVIPGAVSAPSTSPSTTPAGTKAAGATLGSSASEADSGHNVFRRAIAEAESLGGAASQAARSAREAIQKVPSSEPTDRRVEPVLDGADISQTTSQDTAKDDRVEPAMAAASDGDGMPPPPIDPEIAADMGRATPSRLPFYGGIVALVVVVVGIGALVYSQWDLIQSITGGTDNGRVASTGDPKVTPTSAMSPKSTDRLPGSANKLKAPDVRAVQTTRVTPPASNPTANPPGTATTSTPPKVVRNVTPGVVPQPIQPASSGDTVTSETPENPATPTETAKAPDSTPSADAAKTPKIADETPKDGALVAQRAILYEEGASAGARGSAFQGSVTWQVVDQGAADGGPILRARISVPKRDLVVVVSIKRNADSALPASHLVEVLFQVPDNFHAKGIGNVPGLIMKTTEEARGDALAGASARVAQGLFWVALSDRTDEQARNETLLKERGWIDIPLLYENGKRAILTLEKGTPGEKSVNNVLAAWAG